MKNNSTIILAQIEESIGTYFKVKNSRGLEYGETLRLGRASSIKGYTFIDAIRNRKSTRENPSSETLKFSEFKKLVTSCLKRKKLGRDHVHYPTPVAGGAREIRLIFALQKIDGIPNGFWEYSPEKDTLTRISNLCFDLSQYYFEDWEISAHINLLFCINLKAEKRKYPNNLLHCAFECGANTQLLQMLSSSMQLKSCISGYIKKEFLLSKIGLELYPIYGLSIYK